MKKPKMSTRQNFTNTRKVLRKEKRQQKKIHRQEHYMKKKNSDKEPDYSPGKFVKRPAEDSRPESQPKKKKQKQLQSSQDLLVRDRQKEQTEVRKLNSQMEEQRRKILVKANEDEDKVIKKLEKQLGLNKTKNKNNYFADDGLDYLLEICDRATSEQIVAAEKHLANVEAESDFEDDLAAVTGKKLDKNKDKSNKHQESKKDETSDHSDDDQLSEDNDEVSEGDVNEDDLDEDISSNEDTNDEFDEGSHDSEAPEEKPTQSKKSSSKQNVKPEKELIKNIDQKPESKKAGKERIISEDDIGKVFSDDEVSHLSDDEDDNATDNEVGDGEESTEPKTEKPDVWEDIYGRKRDKEGNIIKEVKGVYIPPHLRNKDSGSDKDLAQLKRQIKSVLNKLAGTNLHWACSTIETLYSNNSRHSVNSALSQLWLDATVGESATPDRMVAEHAALVAVLHANVAAEIGAHFLQELCMKFDEMTRAQQPVENKTLDNLVSCLAHLYTFKLYHASLLYDILGRLLVTISEKTVECVVVALRCVGAALRKEEPLMLKTFIHEVQAKVAALNDNAAQGSRVKFLLEVVMAVKNNNLTKIPNYDPSYCDHLRKSCRAVLRKGNYITPLNIRLEDLLKAEERGKWWIVGSAWEGSRPRDEQPAVKAAPSMDEKLLELARKQRMNTDVRRSIFCAIMSAEDYMDAVEKLHRLGLRGRQEREVSHVVLACCLQERVYNPYYGVLARKLCDIHRNYQLSIQYASWDKMKELSALSKLAISNLAQFLVHLIMEKGLPLSVLKIIQFSDLNKHTVRFMRQILLSIIMNADVEASLAVFHRISKAPKLHMFRESLRLFIQHFLVKNAGKNNSVLSVEEMDTLRQRTLEVDKVLTLHETKLKF